MHNKSILCFSLLLLLIVITYFSCNQLKPESKGEILAKQYCATCHLFPAPELLDKDSWQHAVLPRMAYRMGMDIRINFDIRDLTAIKSMVPDSPMISSADYELIKEFYLNEAPEVLRSNQKEITEYTNQFSLESAEQFESARITLLKHNPEKGIFFIGDTQSRLYETDKEFHIQRTLVLTSPASSLMCLDSASWITILGTISQTDQYEGALVSADSESFQSNVLIDSLNRPVYLDMGDINNDHKPDLILASFGNFNGELVIYKNAILNKNNKVVLLSDPGTIRTVIVDWDADGDQDILALVAQGNERVIWFKNHGNYVFENIVLKSFPPAYGSAWIEMIDINQDGQPDIVYSNGDNADFTKIIKPYHGIKIFLHSKATHGIHEDWSYSMPGAYKTCTFDFDGDGDYDIAAISAFPNDDKFTEQNFIYFLNKGNSDFEPQVHSEMNYGQWMTMIPADVDNDKDMDILLGTFSFSPINPSRKNPGVLILRNNLYK